MKLLQRFVIMTFTQQFCFLNDMQILKTLHYTEDLCPNVINTYWFEKKKNIFIFSSKR